MPIVRRLRELHGQGLPQKEVYRVVDSEIQSKKATSSSSTVTPSQHLAAVKAASVPHNNSNDCGASCVHTQVYAIPREGRRNLCR
jgi:hypothetical protein